MIPSPRRPATSWIVLTVALGVTVVGLAVWVALLRDDKESAAAASTARIGELEAENAGLAGAVEDFHELVAGLEQQLEDERAAAEGGAAEAQAQLEAKRAEVEDVSSQLGAKGEELAGTRTELDRLAAEAEAQLADADAATATARDRARAQRARAELAEACLAAVADVLQRLYASEDVAEALETAADELDAIAEECAPGG